MLLSTNAAAAELGVTRSQILKLVNAGRLPAQRIGRDWIIDSRDLAAFAREPRPIGYPKGRKRTPA